MNQQPTNPYANPYQNPAQAAPIPLASKKKKKRGCCFTGCMIMLFLFLALLIGGGIYLYIQGRPQTSQVEKEYNKIPEYFDENN